MADNEQQFQERTEQATPKRLQESRKRGQIPRSRELNMAAVMIAASLAFFAIKPVLGSHLVALIRHGLSIDPDTLRSTDTMLQVFREAGLETVVAFTPLMAILMLAAVGGALPVGGWAFSMDPIAPKFSKLNPLKGIKRVFGLKGLVEVAKALAKAGLIGGVAIGYISWSSDSIFMLGREPLQSTVADSGQLVAMTLLICSLALGLIAAADVPYQIWNHAKELRMTRKEIQDEMKENEGRPEIKSRIRSLQQELANQRMLQDLPTADVIITNPTHFAVALKYAEGQSGAPRVLAKGVDHMAGRIRELGREHKITLFEAPLLARALYWNTEIGQEIPQQLYLAVAQVLTYVFRLKAAAENRGRWPDRPSVTVDEALARNPRAPQPVPE